MREHVVEVAVEPAAHRRIFPAVGAQQQTAQLDHVEVPELGRQLIGAQFAPLVVRQRDHAQVDIAERGFVLVLIAAAVLFAQGNLPSQSEEISTAGLFFFVVVATIVVVDDARKR